MGRDEDQSAVRSPLQLGMSVILANRSLKSINGSVAGYVNSLRVFALLQKILFGKLCRSKIESTDDADRLTVEFLRIWAVDVICAQTGLDMSNRDLQIEASQSCDKSSGGISMNKNHIRLDLFQNIFYSAKDIRCDIEQSLLVLHDGQIVIRNNMEGLEDLIQHLTVLTGYADNCFKIFLVFSSLTNGHILIASGLVPKTNITFFMIMLLLLFSTN